MTVTIDDFSEERDTFFQVVAAHPEKSQYQRDTLLELRLFQIGDEDAGVEEARLDLAAKLRKAVEKDNPENQPAQKRALDDLAKSLLRVLRESQDRAVSRTRTYPGAEDDGLPDLDDANAIEKVPPKGPQHRKSLPVKFLRRIRSWSSGAASGAPAQQSDADDASHASAGKQVISKPGM